MAWTKFLQFTKIGSIRIMEDVKGRQGERSAGGSDSPETGKHNLCNGLHAADLALGHRNCELAGITAT